MSKAEVEQTLFPTPDEFQEILYSRSKKRAYKNRYTKKMYDFAVNAVQRCTNEKVENYNRYGGKGIQFEFKDIWETMNYIYHKLGKPENLNDQVDRIKSLDNYKMGNMRWLSAAGNNHNRDCVHKIDIDVFLI